MSAAEPGVSARWFGGEDMSEELIFKDPYKDQEVRITTVPTDSLEVIEHQRKASPAHIESLTSSIKKLGFLVPLVAVESGDDQGPRFVVIDGQHRLLAAKELGIDEMPVVIVPSQLATRMMNLNVEKDPNIREMSSVAVAIYRHLVDVRPDIGEGDVEIHESVEEIYYVTLGIAYERAGRLSGGALRPLLKKADNFLEKSLKEAYGIREGRADVLVEVDSVIRSIIDQLKDMGADHQYLYPQIIAHTDPTKRKRKDIEFDQTFAALLDKLKKIDEEPESFFRRIAG